MLVTAKALSLLLSHIQCSSYHLCMIFIWKLPSPCHVPKKTSFLTVATLKTRRTPCLFITIPKNGVSPLSKWRPVSDTSKKCGTDLNRRYWRSRFESATL
ncbi:uncharacterized protein BYT42DRAFT_313236 [Radiomyces spectabilis]|uniref:uncharacterized protein n=1 Tax=Radiomyces spectabilis TaxID=64574 RepID=UPI002220791D|nr:uncharacterized protein BYT42DRAFT_313236 [Radiomyces spectabilis]KAI8379102.1 hypothetical protein BYT42DRAFT_313236 [Radiomyces spectabilis]